MNLVADTAYTIASNMTYDQLRNWCNSNREIARYCSEPRFQQLKKRAFINKWIDTIIHMNPNTQYELILVDSNNRDEEYMGHEIIVTKRKNKTFTIEEHLIGIPFTNSLIYQIYFKSLFKNITPTFFDIITNNRPRYNITLEHYNTLDDDINQIRDRIERVYHTQIDLNDTLSMENDYYYNNDVQEARKQIRALLQIPRHMRDNFKFIKQNIDSKRLTRLIELVFSNYTPKIIYND